MSRCDFTDLETSMCAHCRPEPAQPPAAARTHRPPVGGHTTAVRPRPWFTALYDGHCAACGSPYLAGMQIRLEVPAGWRAECCRAHPAVPEPSASRAPIQNSQLP